MGRSRTVQDRIFITKNRIMSRMAKPMILPAMLPSFPSWMHMGQFSGPFMPLHSMPQAPQGESSSRSCIRSLKRSSSSRTEGSTPETTIIFIPVNGECGKWSSCLLRNGFLSLHLRIDAQMGQCLKGIGAQGVSRAVPAVKKLNAGHGAGYVRNVSVWEDTSSNK